MRILGAYLHKQKTGLVLFGLFAAIFAAVLYLNHLPLGAVGYAFLLCAFAATIYFWFSYTRFRRHYLELENLPRKLTRGSTDLPPAADALEELYQNSLIALGKQHRELISQADKSRDEMEDYYTLWAHQIKNPISAMRLLLQDPDELDSAQLALELFKIEQYVEMVLHYLRIESPSSDFQFQNCNLAEMVRQVIHKYARMFIQRKIKLSATDLDYELLTDPKWLCFVLEQVISNALKYTPGGTITITLSEDPSGRRLLDISDNGLGIAPEDLPRIFEKGFTGHRGRLDQRSTGIGLYLCKLVLDKLGHSIEAASTPGRGTTVTIGLDRDDLAIE